MKFKASKENVKVGIKIVDWDGDEGVVTLVDESRIIIMYEKNQNCNTNLLDHSVQFSSDFFSGLYLYVCRKCMTEDCPTNVPYSRERDS